jgi:hypothetical protein
MDQRTPNFQVVFTEKSPSWEFSPKTPLLSMVERPESH